MSLKDPDPLAKDRHEPSNRQYLQQEKYMIFQGVIKMSQMSQEEANHPEVQIFFETGTSKILC
jgi:hypothetical protein